MDRIAVAFVTMLRQLGVEVPVSAALNYFTALGQVGLAQRDNLYWAGRATLVIHPEDAPIYDRVFVAFFDRLPLLLTQQQEVPEEVSIGIDDPDAEDDTDGETEQQEQPQISLRYSAHEVLGDKDFAQYTDEELAEAHLLMAKMDAIGGRRSSRRKVRSKQRRGQPDLRRTVRRALRSAGEPIDRQFTSNGDRLRRVVFLLDVSGSMESYARGLIRFVQAAVVGRGRVEVFTLGTRLTRVTRELSSHDPDRALTSAADAVDDWSGGTRLGDSIAAFNNEWGCRGMARGATVVILSDGWDRGDPEVMAEEMCRLERVAHEIVWVNPLKASPGYEPLAKGMAAAIPHVDRFIEGHSLNSLAHLAVLLAA